MMKYVFLIVIITLGNNLPGQCNGKFDDLRFMLASDETSAYSLLSYSLNILDIDEDSLTVYSVYKFSNQDYFPQNGFQALLLSNLEFNSIQNTGFYAFIEVLLKDGNYTLMRITIMEFKKNTVTHLLSMLQKNCETEDGGVEEYAISADYFDYSVYFDLE